MQPLDLYLPDHKLYISGTHQTSCCQSKSASHSKSASTMSRVTVCQSIVCRLLKRWNNPSIFKFFCVVHIKCNVSLTIKTFGSRGRK